MEHCSNEHCQCIRRDHNFGCVASRPPSLRWEQAVIEDEATREFLVESYEGLDQLDREFVALEADPAQPQRIATIFRIVHTIKGTAGFLGFTRLESLAHAGESLLVLLRDGSMVMTPQTTSALLALVDKVR